MSEKRMYVLVPYNLSDIQKGIQAAHAGMDYIAGVDNEKDLDWLNNHKTMIVLNGGTTGKNSSMEFHLSNLKKLGINFSEFYEPDLNDALTAIAFVVDMEEDSHVVGYLKQMELA